MAWPGLLPRTPGGLPTLASGLPLAVFLNAQGAVLRGAGDTAQNKAASLCSQGIVTSLFVYLPKRLTSPSCQGVLINILDVKEHIMSLSFL